MSLDSSNGMRRHRYVITPETTDGLGTSTQTVPKDKATNTNFTRTNNEQSLAGANRAVIWTMDLLISQFIGWEKSHVSCKNNSLWKIVNERLLKTPVSALHSGTVWVDVSSSFVVSGVANIIIIVKL